MSTPQESFADCDCGQKGQLPKYKPTRSGLALGGTGEHPADCHGSAVERYSKRSASLIRR